MSEVSYRIVRKDERLFFHDGAKYVLFDTGFFRGPGNNSAAVDGRIGPFEVGTMPERFFAGFVNFKMDDGEGVSAVFNPMDGCDCLLAGDTLTISDEEIAPPDHEYAFAFADPVLPVIEGAVNGRHCRLFFDSGARMTMLFERPPAAERIGTYTEWMALKGTYAELQVFEIGLSFPNGFEYRGRGALVDDPTYRMAVAGMNIGAMLGLDLIAGRDVLIAARGKKRGIFFLR